MCCLVQSPMQMEIMLHTHSECDQSLIFPRASCPSKVWNMPVNRNQPGGLFGAFSPLLSWNDRNTSDFIKNIQKYDVDIIKMIIRRKIKITQKKPIKNEQLSCVWKPTHLSCKPSNLPRRFSLLSSVI